MAQTNPHITLQMMITGTKVMNMPILAAHPWRVLANWATCQV